MNKFYFILLLCLFSSCRINKTNHVETCKTENDSTEQFYDQSEGMEILDTLGKVYGNEPHIAGLSWFFVKFGGTSSIVNKESWLSVVYFLPYCTSAFLAL